MNRKTLLLRSILENPNATQRSLCMLTGTALGTVNGLIRECTDEGLIRTERQKHVLTGKGFDYLKPFRVDAALILAAGFGSRFVPLTYETPKGLLDVFGEPMIERQIRQLKEAGISDIAIIVGYMKEKFEYLTEKFGVQLIFNPEYAEKNNLSSIYHADAFLHAKPGSSGSSEYRNCYILSSDNWLRENLYHSYEACAWYSAQYSDGPTGEWVLVMDKKGRITDTYPGGKDCLYMYGPAYFSSEFADEFMPVLKKYHEMPGTENCYWENVLMDMLNGSASKRLNAYFGREESRMVRIPEMYVNESAPDTVYEFENLEELRQFDPRYRNDSGSEAMRLVSRVFGVPESDITGIRCLKSGMTNNSWLFCVGGCSYICRIPGEGTELLIDRRHEAKVFEAIKPLSLSEDVIYFDEDTGYKISRFYEGSRNADRNSDADLAYCMKMLRLLHESGISVDHSFDIFERIGYYEELCVKESRGAADIFGAFPFSDYRSLRPNVDRLRKLLENRKEIKVLAHIDPVPDNFIFLPGGEPEADVSGISGRFDRDHLRLIDWEYSGMCDPLADIAMCAIYSYMDEKRAMWLLETYLGRTALDAEKCAMTAYMALGGLLWSLWAVYKEEKGVSFSDYTIRMYRYFRDFGRRALNAV